MGKQEKDDRAREVFTTGQVAKICQVAPRTVSKWFDTGKLRGYRIPGSQDRRIPREALIRFLRENRMDDILEKLQAATAVMFAGVGDLLTQRVAELLPPGTLIRRVEDLFSLALELRVPPVAVLVSASISSRPELQIALARLAVFCNRVVVLLPEDATADPACYPGCEVVVSPVDPARLAGLLSSEDENDDR